MARDIIEENPNLKVIETNKEEGVMPFFMIEDVYGVAVDERQYMLCKKKSAKKIVKDDEGNPSHIETYYRWDSFKYTHFFKDIIECYVELKDRELNISFEKNAEFKDILKNQQEIKNILNRTFSNNYKINKDVLECSDLIDLKESLKLEINNVKLELKDIMKQKDELITMIKEQRKIIVDQIPKSKTKVKTNK